MRQIGKNNFRKHHTRICPGIESRWGKIFAPVQTFPGAHPAPCKMGTGCLPGIKSGRGLTLTTHSFLVPWSGKSRAITLLPIWAVRPVHILSACTRVHFTFTFTYLPYSYMYINDIQICISFIYMCIRVSAICHHQR